MVLGFGGRNKKGKQTESDSSSLGNEGRWKHCIHSESGRIYYYHTKTKETTWNKPDSFHTWKVVKDKSSGRPYFYNRITRETTWEKPSEFEEWRSAVEKNSGSTYYYNVITQETTWLDPRAQKTEPKDAIPNEQITNLEASKIERTESFVPILQEFLSFMDPSKNKQDNNDGSDEDDDTNAYNAETSITGDGDIARNSYDKEAKLAPIFIPVSKSRFSVSYKSSRDEDDANSTPEKKILQVSFDEDEINKIDKKSYPPNSKTLSVSDCSDMIEYKNPDQQRLAKLLSLYMPMNKDLNAHFLKSCRGHEKSVLEDIDKVIQDSPFDEISIGIYRYANGYIDHNEDKKESKAFSKSRGYPLKHPILSVLSTRTEQTARVQNKAPSAPITNRTQDNGPWLQPSIPENVETLIMTETVTLHPLYESEPSNSAENSNIVSSEKEVCHTNDIIASNSFVIEETPTKSVSESIEHLPKDDVDTSLTTESLSMDATEESVSDLSDSFSPFYGKRSMREKNRIEKWNHQKIKEAAPSPLSGLEKMSVFCQPVKTIPPKQKSATNTNGVKARRSKPKEEIEENDVDEFNIEHALEKLASWFRLYEDEVEEEMESSDASSNPQNKKITRSSQGNAHRNRNKTSDRSDRYYTDDIGWDKAACTPPMYTRRARKLTM